MTSPALYLPADWPAPDGIVAGTTFRTGGVSRGVFASLNLGAHVGDDAGAVTENRRRFRAACGPGETRWLRQVHGTAVAVDPARDTVPTADALVSTRPGVACVVLTADCLPVLFTTAHGDAVAAAHAGWRGLLAGILESTVQAFGRDPETLLVWLGPAISQPAFEVGDEVRQAFVDDDGEAAACFAANPRGRWQADLYALARQRLARAGVERITGGGHCTAGDAERWFSYRRDGQCGRMASFVGRSATPGPCT